MQKVRVQPVCRALLDASLQHPLPLGIHAILCTHVVFRLLAHSVRGPNPT
jgi:hypothetical protein